MVTPYNYSGFKTYVEFVENNSGNLKFAKIATAVSTPLLVGGCAVVATVSLGSVVAVVLMSATAVFALATLAALIALVVFKCRANNEEQKLFYAIKAKRPIPPQDIKADDAEPADEKEREAFRKLLKTGTAEDWIIEVSKPTENNERTAFLERTQLLLVKLTPDEVTKKYALGQCLAFDILDSTELQRTWRGPDRNAAKKITQLFREVVVRGGNPNLLRKYTINETDNNGNFVKADTYEFSLLRRAIELNFVEAVKVLKGLGATNPRSDNTTPLLPNNEAYQELVKTA